MDDKPVYCDGMCRLSDEEREWVHTANKYVDTKHLPTLGKVLKAFEDTSYAIGRAVLMSIIVGGAALFFWWMAMRFK